MSQKRFSTFTSKDGSISIQAYVGNGHGVHTNLFPVQYEELFDVPENVIFRTNQCLISSAYCRITQSDNIVLEDGITLEQVIDRIEKGLLWKKRDGLCHSDLATKDSVMTYLKYIKTSDVKYHLRVFNFDQVLDYEVEKAKKAISSSEEAEWFQQIMQLDSIKDSFSILSSILSFEDSEFKRAALLLLKCKVYDIEDQHYLQSKKHDKEEVDSLKQYRKSLFSQMR